SQKQLEINENELLTNELKMAIAERDLEIHEQNMEQNQEILDFYADKMTNEALYHLMSGHLTRLFRDTYGLAFQMALDAQTAFRFEMNDETASYIGYDNWDTASMGLLSAEKLQYQLMQMETAFMERNTRKAEIQGHVSLAMLNPNALLELKGTGQCIFSIPEAWFDIQYPGQYKRRIKSVSLTIPCVTGPYVNVACKLKMMGSRLRASPDLGEDLVDALGLLPEGNDRIFTSTAQNDAGILEFNFRDERYLPFEGAGVDSTWEIKLPEKLRSFDYNTINDVIFHINYTAEYDETFRGTVENGIEAELNRLNQGNGLFRVLSLKHEFPNEWYQASASETSVNIELRQEHFPFFAKEVGLEVSSIALKEVNAQNGTVDEINGAITSPTGPLPISVEVPWDSDTPDKELFLVVNYGI
ncbi:MAG: hypothetical protein AB3N16_09770, partial [Flavobacteriaceae bacterium]